MTSSVEEHISQCSNITTGWLTKDCTLEQGVMSHFPTQAVNSATYALIAGKR